MALVFAAGAGDAAKVGSSAGNARVIVPEPRTLVPESTPLRSAPWAASLAAVDVINRNTQKKGSIKLYTDDGTVDPNALHEFVRIAASSATPEPLDKRLVQLAFRASYHFGGKKIVIVSATRRNTRGKHAHGEALDFQLEGVPARKLASYLRTYPRAGVGIYTHPKTQYVHLDVRERSYHWIDASPPGVTWREKLLRDPTQAKRDASWRPAMDLPEAATAP